MNIYGLPTTLPAPEIDYLKQTNTEIDKLHNDHKAELKKYLINKGYDKPLTGEILLEPVADGYAQYMVFDGGRQWGLIHLPYDDAYESENVSLLTKSEVKKRISRLKELSELFV